MKNHSLTAVDLFSGCGGLTRGLKQAGFTVVGAIEKDEDAASTYAANHPDVELFMRDIRWLPASELRSTLSLDGRRTLDLIAGCPPCQGFTRLTEKSRRDDPRNDLVLQYARFIRMLRPRACMMENVPGLLTRGREFFEKLKRRLEGAGYIVTHKVVELADYGVPQFRKRLVLLAGRGFEIPIPSPTHGDPATETGVLPWRTVRDAIAGMPAPPRRSAVRANKAKPPYSWHYARDVAEVVRKRLEHARRNGGDRIELPDSLRLDCHERTPDGYYDVYGVIAWDQPSPTITSGCTNASKGRFGHPGSPRPLTAREAARLQSFPLDYKFVGTGVESIALQIGNALPSRFAKVVGRAVAKSVREHKPTS